MKTRKWICGFLAVALMLALPVFAAAQDTIKIGATEPLSGTFKDIGERYLEGVQYAAKVINESGGLLGKKVEVIPDRFGAETGCGHPQGPGADPEGRGQVFLRRDGKLRRGGHVPARGERERDHVHLRHGRCQHDRREVQQELLPAGRKHGRAFVCAGSDDCQKRVQGGRHHRPGLLLRA